MSVSQQNLNNISLNKSYSGAQAASHASWQQKLDFRSMKWPVVDFPCLKYPLEEHERENRLEEGRSLSEVKSQSNQN